MHDGDDDPDRAAILARRQRFIAIALSGLASGAACAPQACLRTIDPDDGRRRPPPAHPEACLSIAVPEPDEQGDEGAAKPDEATPPPQAPSPEPTPPKYVPRAEPEPCLTLAPRRR